MNKNILDNIIDICKLEITEAQMKLDTENLKPFDQQYQIGRKLAAKDIMRRVEELKNDNR